MTAPNPLLRFEVVAPALYYSALRLCGPAGLTMALSVPIITHLAVKLFMSLFAFGLGLPLRFPKALLPAACVKRVIIGVEADFLAAVEAVTHFANHLLRSIRNLDRT